MAVTVLGIAGSARRGGNTDTLLEWCLDAARGEGADIVSFRLCDLDLRGCRACDACFQDGHCIQKDDMQKLYPHLRTADSIVVAAPVYSMGMPGTPKIMIDRCQPFWALKYVLKQPLNEAGGPERLGAFLSCAGTNFAARLRGEPAEYPVSLARAGRHTGRRDAISGGGRPGRDTEAGGSRRPRRKISASGWAGSARGKGARWTSR